jgi:hypothetical protein
MKLPVSFLRLTGLGAVLAVASVSARAQDDSDAEWDHLGLNFRAAFNVKAKFALPSSGSGGALPPGPGAGSALDHQYSDGFVNVDSSGNKGGVTWNWGYDHASQVSGGDVLMHATGGMAGGNESMTDNPDPGFNLDYVRDLGHQSWGRWGIKFGVGYTPIDIRDNDPMTVSAVSITDKYALSGVTPPNAPYSGSFGGPGPVLGSEPISRTTADTGAASVTGSHDISAALFDVRLGPTAHIPLGKGFSVEGAGGFALGIASSRFSFSESTGGGVPVSASDSRTGLLPGAFGELGFGYRIGNSVSVFTGAQFEYLGDFNQSAAGRDAKLDLGSVLFYELGLQWHF